MGFLRDLFGKNEIDHAVTEITRNIFGLINPHSKYHMEPFEYWYGVSMNIKGFYFWLTTVRGTNNIHEKTNKWIDLLLEMITTSHDIVLEKSVEETLEMENYERILTHILTISQVYSYCVQLNYIPMLNNMPHPSMGFHSKFIYDVCTKTLNNILSQS